NIGRQPADAVIVADHDLEPPPAVVERASELRLPLRSDRILLIEAERMKLAASDVRRRVRWQCGGVDRHREARLLCKPRSREAHHARAEHGDGAAVALQAELGGELRAAPAQGDARAAVAVIM